MIAIINYKAGNIASVSNALKRIGVEFFISSNPKEIEKADKIIFPGVGNFDFAMKELEKNNLIEFIKNTKKPLLGICLGMQILCSFSEEGNVQGLNIFSEKIKKFPKLHDPQTKKQMPVPHIGWNSVKYKKGHPLFKNILQDSDFYFVHSYCLSGQTKATLSTTNYGIEFTSAIYKNNFYAVQFHPEKSGKAGLQLLQNFYELEIPTPTSIPKEEGTILPIPAIDIINEECVRLSKGDYNLKTSYTVSPLEMVKTYEAQGFPWVHIVDLDRAKGDPSNLELIKKITSETSVNIQTGGGIRTTEDLEELFTAGVKKVVVGSVALKNPKLLKKWIQKFGEEKIILAADSLDEKVLHSGWQEGEGKDLFIFLKEMQNIGVKEVLATDIAQDGLLQGPNFALYKKIKQHFPQLTLIASGGISCLEDLKKLDQELIEKVVVGKAIYENKIELAELITLHHKPLLKGEVTKKLNSPFRTMSASKNVKKRIIPCLDIKNGRTVKGCNFVNLQDAGDPVELAKIYSENGADELVFLDISATQENRTTFVELVKKIAKEIQIPFTVGGGITSCEQIEKLLQAGADKVSLNSAALKNPLLIQEASNQFGAQCVVVAVDIKKTNTGLWKVFSHGGEKETKRELVTWLQEIEKLGAGEILLTSMDYDGTKQGFDLEALQMANKAVNLPLIASGGAGTVEHFKEVFQKTSATGALAASVFHFKEIEIKDLKKELRMRKLTLQNINWKKVNNLIPVIIQDEKTKQVLMLGFMNREALEHTLETKQITFFSRTKQRLWTKGEKSGNFLELKQISLDCDSDTLLCLVKAPEATCHTGDFTCFQEEKLSKHTTDILFLSELSEKIKLRKKEMPKDSYTTELFEKGLNKITQKVGEEGVEVVIAALGETKERLISESADLLYHWLVLLAEKEVDLEEVIKELKKR